jgi:Alpha amylase, catalytic domain
VAADDGAGTSDLAVPLTSDVGVVLDGQSGLPRGWVTAASRVVPLTVAVELESGGDEMPGTTGGLTYVDTQRHQAARLGGEVSGTNLAVQAGEHTIETDAGAWRLRTTISTRPTRPRFELRFAASPQGNSEILLRDLRITMALDDPTGWFVEAPGNMIRPGVAADAVSGNVTVRGAGHELGSPGLIALHRGDDPLTVVVWPFSRAEPATMTLRPDTGGLHLEIDTGLAGAVAPDEWLEHGPIYLDAIDRPWSDVVHDIKRWYPAIGMHAPADRPTWTAAVNIFEVMVGSAPFHGGHSYSPYPTVADLIADLDRISRLGFDCVQLMPRHPYPSYNIHETGDVAITYGDPQEIRRLVTACHQRGLRIILDILLHGVVDKDVIRRTVALVERGPYAERLDEPCADVYDQASVDISWCRHIVAFAPHWIEGSPEHHGLLDTQPEWFMRDSRGAVTGIYTHALDIANRDWQDHFIAACEYLIGDHGFDGFRFDAPLYNHFANWSPATRRHASHSSLAAFDLLRRLRQRLHALRDDLLLLSEPGGALARESLDVCYSYDELWLPAALFDHNQSPTYDWRRVHNGKELATWCRDLDATLPEGSVSAHFIDVHDTMWWRLPGDQWRREQIGLDATKAALVIHALRGGAFMTFVGGEYGIEAELARILALRRDCPELRDGVTDYDAAACDADAIYCVIRRTSSSAALVAVNTSTDVVRCTCVVSSGVPLVENGERLVDTWNGEDIRHEITDNTVSVDLSFHRLQPRVLVRATSSRG